MGGFVSPDDKAYKQYNIGVTYSHKLIFLTHDRQGVPIIYILCEGEK